MTARLALAFLRSSPGRAALVAGCAAPVAALLLASLAVLGYPAAGRPEPVSDLVADGALRAGYLLALGLTCLAPLTVLRQVLRLGTAAREQRLAALRLAGATPTEVRRVAAYEVAAPALLGGGLGYPLFRLLRRVLGGTGTADLGEVRRQLALVPAAVPLPWWQVLGVIVLLGMAGAAAGATTTRSLVVSPHGVARRAPRPVPRLPWLPLLLAGAGLVAVGGRGADAWLPALLPPAVVATLVLGVLAVAPWVAHRVGSAVARRASSAPLLIAARRLATDPRPAGRAAAAVGAIALVAGGGGSYVADLPGAAGGAGLDEVDPFYVVPAVLAGVVLLLALALVVLSLAVHGVETLLDRKRSIASLSALGVSAAELARVQRWEVGLVALPMAVLGVLVGSLPSSLLVGVTAAYAWIPLVVDVVTVALVWVAVLASTRLTGPWVRRAAAPVNLRTT